MQVPVKHPVCGFLDMKIAYGLYQIGMLNTLGVVMFLPLHAT